MRKEIFNQKGALLYYTVVITSILLAIALGLGTILISQIRGLREMGNSTIAFFGADSGMERLLYFDAICQRQESCSTTSPFFNQLCFGQAELAGTTTCIGLFNFSTSSDLIVGSRFEANVTTTAVVGGATTFFRSKGIYRESQRQIETSRPVP